MHSFRETRIQARADAEAAKEAEKGLARFAWPVMKSLGGSFLSGMVPAALSGGGSSGSSGSSGSRRAAEDFEGWSIAE